MIKANSRLLTVQPLYCHDPVPPRLNPSRRRRLVDYTQCRRDGTRSRALNMQNPTTRSPKKDDSLAMPTCRSLDASITNLLDAIDVTNNESKDSERIDFYLKVTPKNQRRNPRVSTLDTIGGPRKILQRSQSTGNDRIRSQSSSLPILKARSKSIASMFRKKSSGVKQQS